MNNLERAVVAVTICDQLRNRSLRVTADDILRIPAITLVQLRKLGTNSEGYPVNDMEIKEAMNIIKGELYNR